MAAIITAGWAAISAKLGAWSGPIGWVLGIVGVAAVGGLSHTIADAFNISLVIILQ